MPDDSVPPPTASATASRLAPRRLLGIGSLVAVALAVAVYGIMGLPGNGGFGDPASPCAGTGEIVARIKPAIHGEVAALVPATGPLLLSKLSFRRDDGTPGTLADWSGKTVLLNLWATWCAPCRAEMPALDRLQAALGGKDFDVVTINVDTANAGDKPKTFLADIGVKALGFQSDPSLGVFKALQKIGRSRGLPTTMLIDAKGCEIGTMYGPAGWDQPDGQRLIAAALGRT